MSANGSLCHFYANGCATGLAHCRTEPGVMGTAQFEVSSALRVGGGGRSEDRTCCKIVVIWRLSSPRPGRAEHLDTAPRFCGLKLGHERSSHQWTAVESLPAADFVECLNRAAEIGAAVGCRLVRF
jgi:hypothetical protein